MVLAIHVMRVHIQNTFKCCLEYTVRYINIALIDIFHDRPLFTFLVRLT